MSHLQLSLTDYQDETRWRWVLNDANGNFLADHEVSLDRSAKEYSGFAFLPDYLKYYQLPTVTMETLLEEVGQWMGQQVFGGLLEALSDEMTYPATVVQVHIPSEAQDLLFRPFELAYLDGEPFAQCGIRFVYELVDEQTKGRKGRKSKKGKPGNELRVLAVFSLPSQASPLNLRRERYGLAQLVDQLRQTRGTAVTLRVIQYGATRQTLKDALRQGGGWDMIHLSGHGLSGHLMLEDSEGKPDVIQADELAKLLRPTRRRVKLLTLSACLSGAGSLQQARVMLGLSSETLRTGSVYAQSAQETRLPSLAQKLSQALGCAALAMRYPVGDSFATQLALKLYESLFNDQQSLPNALQIALDRALSAEYAQSTPLSPVTPILFGTQATDLRLTPPLAPGQHEVPTTGLLNFPPEPERFVGRVLPMLRASQGLAPRSRYNGVLFYGMAGAGKTSCSLELAYRHETGRFLGYVWFKAPDEGHDIHGTLANFLQSIENQLDLEQRGILTAHLNDPQDFDFSRRTLPRLQGMLRQHATLIVIDNIESLLTQSGDWRDPKWGILIDALLTRTGASRLVFTSRRLPTALTQHPRLLRLSIHALSLGESVLLARELEHLRTLFADETGRPLLQHTLNMAQGHPKLLELADKMAADGQLAALTPDSTPTDNQRLDAFFRTGESQQSAEDFIATLRYWTTTLTATLPPTAHLLFHFLCRLEEEDRLSNIIKGNWEGFAGRLKGTTPAAVTALNQPNLALDSSLAALTNVGLIESRVIELNSDQSPIIIIEDGSNLQSPVSFFRIHPAIAETERDQADAVVLSACDIELDNYWGSLWQYGIKTEMEGGTRRVVISARRAAPYLLRRERWQAAGTLLERIIERDQTPATLAFALPLLRQIAAATQGTDLRMTGNLAKALLRAGRYVEAEQLLRDTMAQSVAQGDYRLASATAGQLGDLLWMMAHYDEALDVVGKKADYTLRAGFGPWSQLSTEGQRLQILCVLGRYDEVLKEVNALRPQLAALPDKSAVAESADPWNVRETMLGTGCVAAQQLEKWQRALDLNAEILAYQQKRGADEVKVARTRFNDYAPLLRLCRYGDVRALLMHCRAVFEKNHEIASLGQVLGALGDLEYQMGNRAVAVQFSQSALRYTYQAGEPEACAISHNNLAVSLEQTGATANLVLAHRLATCIIGLQTQSGALTRRINNLANSPMPASPPTFDEVVATVELTSSVRFRELFARLPKRAPNGDAAMAAVWGMAKKRRAEREQVKKGFDGLPPAIIAPIESGSPEKAMEALMQLPPKEQQAVMEQMNPLVNQMLAVFGQLSPKEQQAIMMQTKALVKQMQLSPKEQQAVMVQIEALEEQMKESQNTDE